MERTLWTRFAIIGLGIWMIAFPFTFDNNSWLMMGSDFISGALLIIFGGYSLSSQKQWPLWVICLIGVWLQFAPLAFWAPDGLSYVNDTIIGFLVMALSIVLPYNPMEEEVKGGATPPGWSYNPSSFLQRLPLVLFGFLAWMFSRYMAAYQLGYIDYVWDPFFGDGTEKVITSALSKRFPVPDAGLGAMAYTIETLMACHGSVRRWHTLPWFVALFAILVVPVGFTSILLIMMQPIIVGYWCSWCLFTAVCMLIMIALAIDEVVAVLQFLRHEKKRTGSYKEAFWKGATSVEATEDMRSPAPNASVKKTFPAMVWGVSIPWNLVVTAALGAWLMFSPKFMHVTGGGADANHVLGSLVVAFSIICMGEVVRAGRFVVTFLGLLTLIFTWIVPGIKETGMINQIVVGAVLILLSLPKGPIRERYGDWEKFIV